MVIMSNSPDLEFCDKYISDAANDGDEVEDVPPVTEIVLHGR